MPVVMVEIAPPTAPAELIEALLDACSRAVRVGQCAVDDAKVSGEPVAVAIVHWENAEKSRFRVEVGVRNAGEPVWSNRDLDFDIADPPAERWKAAGLTIATLAGEMVAGAERADAHAGVEAKRPSAVTDRDGRSPASPKGPGRSPASAKTSGQSAPRRQTLWNWSRRGCWPRASTGAVPGGWARGRRLEAHGTRSFSAIERWFCRSLSGLARPFGSMGNGDSRRRWFDSALIPSPSSPVPPSGSSSSMRRFGTPRPIEKTPERSGPSACMAASTPCFESAASAFWQASTPGSSRCRRIFW